MTRGILPVTVCVLHDFEQISLKVSQPIQGLLGSFLLAPLLFVKQKVNHASVSASLISNRQCGWEPTIHSGLRRINNRNNPLSETSKIPRP